MLDVGHRGPDGHGLVEHGGEGHVGGQQRVQVGHRGADAVHRVDDVGAGLAEDDEQRSRLAVGEADRAEVLDRVVDLGHVGQPHRGPVAPGDEQGSVLAGEAELIAGGDLPRPLGPVQLALGAVDVRAGQHRAHVLEPDPVAGERVGVQLHPHRGQRAAAHEHLAHAVDLGQLLLEDRGGHVVELAGARGGRGQRQDHDRRVGGVHLAVGRVARQVRRQLPARRVDGRLHVAGGPVDVAREIELQGHARRAEEARRGHLGHRCDAGELPLERRGHRGGHRLRARAGQPGRDADGGEVHLGQWGHRQQAEGDGAGQHQRDGQQRGADRAADERGGEVHGREGCGGATAGAPAAARARRAPRAARRSKAR